eukprot:UC4_evm4s619
MSSSTTTTTTETKSDGTVVITTTTVITTGNATAAFNSNSFPFLQAPTAEDPKALPFRLPAGVDDVDAKWMQDLLRHRGIINSSVTVSSIEKKGVGTPVNFIVKAWPPLELLPKEAIGNMFAADIRGYTEFKAEEFYPRPDCYLATMDIPANLYVLVLQDADDIGTHKVHEKELDLQETLKMIPYIARHAARYENCHLPDNKYAKATSHVPPFWIREYLDVYYNPTQEGKPFTDGKFSDLGIGHEWEKNGMGGYAKLLGDKWQAFFAQTDPANGASVSLCHGDLRGDNLFFTDTNAEGWMAIDFQLGLKSPVPSDLAYLMVSGSVLPEVYNEGEEKVLRAFYDEFQKHTQAYKSDVYSFEQMKKEYLVMSHLLYLYFVAMGAVIWQSSMKDGKLDPSQPDKIVGPIGAAPEIGTGAIKVEDLSPEDMRKRMWWSKTLRNCRDVFKKHGAKELLESLPNNHYTSRALENATNGVKVP